LPRNIILIHILHICIVTNYAYLFLIKKTKHIFFNDTSNVTNIILYNINSYLFYWHSKYGNLITKFVIGIIGKEKINYSHYTHTHTYYRYILQLLIDIFSLLFLIFQTTLILFMLLSCSKKIIYVIIWASLNYFSYSNI